jgi:hypothetical protein
MSGGRSHSFEGLEEIRTTWLIFVDIEHVACLRKDSLSAICRLRMSSCDHQRLQKKDCDNERKRKEWQESILR